MEPRTRCKIILNPTAGKGRAGERAGEIEALLTAHGIAHEVVLTKAVWHAAELARDAGREGYGIVVAAGGDGTVNEVVNGLMLAAERGERPPALAAFSVGRGNDFAYGADLPSDLAGCVDVLAGGQERPLDVGRVVGGYFPEGRYFANGLGAGFDTIVGLEAAKMRHVHGAMAYVLGAVKTFIEYPEAPEVAIVLDGDEAGAIRQRSHMISVMNGKRLGGTFFMAPRARNHDGLLDLCMTAGLTRRQMVSLVSRYVKGSQAGHPLIRTGKAARLSIRAPQGGLVVHADGETVCTDGDALEISCLPSRLRILYSPDLAAAFDKRDAAQDAQSGGQAGRGAGA
jgi:YegS/Rv2252/BmrU family lipid kinase